MEAEMALERIANMMVLTNSLEAARGSANATQLPQDALSDLNKALDMAWSSAVRLNREMASDRKAVRA